MNNILRASVTVLLSATIYAGGASAQCGSAGSQVPVGVVVYGETGFAGQGDLDSMVEACTGSLHSAIKRCEAAGGKPESLTSIPPTVTTSILTSSSDRTKRTIILCQWNVGCVFPSKAEVPCSFPGML